MSQASWSGQFFIKLLRKAQFGTIKIYFPDGQTEIFGQGDLVANVTIKDWKAFDLMAQKGDIGLAEAVIEDLLETDDMAALVRWACLNDQTLENTIHGTWTGTFLYQIKNFLNRNSKVQAKKNIMAHYDLGNDFYKIWLDPTMSYSSAIFKNQQETLMQAQLNKYDRIIENLQIKSSDHLLEIGCGWGGFFSRAVEKTGCRVTAVMNSPRQAAHNRSLIAEKRLSSYVDLQEIDYRDIKGSFDKIVSIEMIEAVGEKYWKDYFDKVSASLKNAGLAVIQGITIQDNLFYSYKKNPDFIQSYVFPGGMLLSDQIFKNLSLEKNMPTVNQHDFGLSYAETLKIWRINFNKNIDMVKQLGFDDKFIRLWNLYLSYCEGAFRAGRINVSQYTLQRN